MIYKYGECIRLKSVTIPNNVTSIGEYAFEGCKDLTSVNFPSNVTSIGAYAFEECNKVEDVFCFAESIPTTGESVFDNISDNAVLHVPTASIEDYATTEPWSNFGRIVAIPENVNIVVKANNYTREYGEENPAFEYYVAGEGLIGIPEISCEATMTSPVGTYPIVVKAGSLTNKDAAYQNGTLTITKAPLTVAANSYAIKQGAPLPNYGFTCKGLKNEDTESVLSAMPILTCLATSSNELATYEIQITGDAEAENYDLSYQNGVLQVSIPGDVTGSGTVDVEDATLTVNFIMGTNDDKGNDYKFAVADMNDDDEVDVYDVTGMIGTILDTDTQVAAKARRVASALPQEEKEHLCAESSADGLMLNVDQAERFTSFQMDVEVADGVALTGARMVNNGTGHVVRYAKVGQNQYRVLGISMKSAPMKASEEGLLELSLSDVRYVQIDNILFVTPKGEAVRFGALSYNDATGIAGIAATQTGDGIFDLSGRKMNVSRSQLPKGVYIINKKKVVIK